MANVKITDLTALSGALVGADLFEMVDDVAGTPVSRKVTAAVVREFSNMVQATGTDADTTMAINTLYVVDMSAWATADRTYTLPATAAVGDRIGIMVTAGDASHELLITATSGDTLNGISGGTEWSRLFISNEVVIMRCIVANATWVVEYDGRIPQQAMMELTTASDGNNSGTYYRPTQTSTPGAWTARADNASIVSTSLDAIYARRAGNYLATQGYAPKDAGTTGVTINCRGALNGTTELFGPSTVCTAATINRCAAAKQIVMAAGDYVQYQYRTGDANIGAAAQIHCFLSLTEVL